MRSVGLAMMFRFFWICLLLNEICCQQLNQGMDVPQSFGFYRFQIRPVKGSVQPVSDAGATKAVDEPSYNEPVKGIPTASELGAPLTQESQVQMPENQAIQTLEYPYTSTQFGHNRMPDNQAIYLPTFPMGYNALSQTQAGQEWAPPSATDMGQEMQSVSQAAQMPAVPARVKVPAAPVSQAPDAIPYVPAVPASVKVPTAPVSQAPDVIPYVPAVPASVKVPTAPVSQAPDAIPYVPEATAPRPPVPAPVIPHTAAQMPASVSSNPVGFHGSFFTGGEDTSTDVEGPSSGQERYFTLTAPSGFHTRYIVRSYNRYMHGKRVFSQTTYTPLDFPPSAPAVPPTPPPEQEAKEVLPARKG